MRSFDEAMAAARDRRPFSNGETWRSVVGYEGLYEVSNLGRVRAMRRRGSAGNLLRPCVCRKGHLSVSLWRDNCGRTIHVHRLVAAAFLGPCPPGQETRHGPGGAADNRVVNLSYGTAQENNDDQLRDGTRCRGVDRWSAKLTAEQVLDCRVRHHAGESQRALATEFGVSLTAMHNAIRGKNWGWLS